MSYLLDANVVSYFRQVGRGGDLSRAARTVTLTIVDEVRVELRNDPSRGGKAFDAWLAASGIEVRAILVGSPAANTLAHLAPPGITKNLGERASIALAAHEPSLIFVTHDHNGARVALRELWRQGEKLLGVAPFLRRLFEAQAVSDPETLDDVFALVPHDQPTWWPSWRASLASPSAG